MRILHKYPKIGWFLVLLGTLALAFFAKDLAYIPTYHTSVSNVQYDSKSDNPALATPFSKKFHSPKCTPKQPKSFSMKLHGEVYEVFNWQNLFQTADINDGLRFEINASGNSGFLGKDVTGTAIPNFQFKPNTPWNIEVKSSKTGYLTIKINNKRYLRGMLEKPWALSHLKIGEGFDETRTTKGKITNANISITCYKKFSFIVYFLFTIAVLGSFFCLYRISSIKINVKGASFLKKCKFAIACLGLLIAFLLPDLTLFNLTQHSLAYGLFHGGFVVLWSLFFIWLLFLIPHHCRLLIGTLLVLIVNLLACTHVVYWNMFHTLFSFNNLRFATEGLSFISLVKDYLPIRVLLLCLTSITLAYWSIKQIACLAFSRILLGLVGGGILFSYFALLLYLLGPTLDAYQQYYESYPVFTYRDFRSNYIENFHLSGMYHVAFRDIKDIFSTHFLNDKKAIEAIQNFKQNKKPLAANQYTGLLKGKNLVLVLIESGDYLAISPTNTPVIARLMREGINFSNHFSTAASGAGPTFNAEFSVNTGLSAPVRIPLKAENLSNNYYPFALAELFRKNGYTTASIHMNSGKFYNRSALHKAWGYDHSYFLLDLPFYTYQDVRLDTDLIQTPTLTEMFSHLDPNKKFALFFISYTGHAPYTFAGNCSMLLTEKEQNALKPASTKQWEACLKAQVRNTDDFFKLLITKLEEKEVLDSTVIVAFTDHYAYGFPDHEYLRAKRGESNIDLLNHSPFFIWGKGISAQHVSTPSANIDIYPTLLNLWGLASPNMLFMGQDILSSDCPHKVLFSDHAFLDREGYHLLAQGQTTGYTEFAAINDSILKTNYFNL